jgi:probable phosphoglycerate mutase
VELIFVRHGTAVLEDGVTAEPDPHLAAAGYDQACAAGAALAGGSVGWIGTSPLRRAAQTAEAMGGVLGVPVEVVDGLAEFDRDFGHYVPGHEVDPERAGPHWRAVLEGRWAELGSTLTPETFRERVVACVENIAARRPADTVALVTHGGVINAYLGHVLGLPAWPMRFYLSNCSFTRLVAAGNGRRGVLSVNDQCHTRGVDAAQTAPATAVARSLDGRPEVHR